MDAAFNTLVHNFTEGIFGRSIFGEKSPVPQDLIVQRTAGQPGVGSTAQPDDQAQQVDSASDKNASQSAESTTQEPTVEEQLVRTGIEMFSGLLGGSRSQSSN